MRPYRWLFAILFVAPDGTGLYPTIQSAVDAAVDGDQVRLYSGVYGGEGNQSIKFSGKAIVVTSDAEDPSAVTMAPDIYPIAFVFDSFEGPGSILQDITFACATWTDRMLFVGGSPTIRNCVFDVNGVSMLIAGGPRIESCNFLGGPDDFATDFYFGHRHFVMVNCSTPNGAHVGGEDCLLYRCDFARVGVSGEGVLRESNVGTLTVRDVASYGGCTRIEDCVVGEIVKETPLACYRMVNTAPAELDGPLNFEAPSWGSIKGSYR